MYSHERGDHCTHPDIYSLKLFENTGGLSCSGHTLYKEFVEAGAYSPTEAQINTFEKAVDSILAELRELMISKQKDYGPQNILSFGEYGVLVRVNDKVERLKNLHKAGRNPNNESIDDTWKDIANYGIISLMVRRNIFNLPLGDDPQA